MKDVDLREPTSFLGHVYLGWTWRETTWKVMQRNACADIANLRIKRLSNYTESQHDALATTNWRKNGELSQVCSQIVLKCLSLARIGRPDILWSANKLARAVTKWTQACDKRLARLISYGHHTCEYRQYCHVGTLMTRSQHQEEWIPCIFGSHTFVPIGRMCQKQTSVSHSSTEAEVISLDAG